MLIAVLGGFLHSEQADVMRSSGGPKIFLVHCPHQALAAAARFASQYRYVRLPNPSVSAKRTNRAAMTQIIRLWINQAISTEHFGVLCASSRHFKRHRTFNGAVTLIGDRRFCPSTQSEVRVPVFPTVASRPARTLQVPVIRWAVSARWSGGRFDRRARLAGRRTLSSAFSVGRRKAVFYRKTW